jgi:glycosyltransferase involved in cell wall biosynthesis
MVDDNSTDRTANWLLAFAKEHPLPVNKENQGAIHLGKQK